VSVTPDTVTATPSATAGDANAPVALEESKSISEDVSPDTTPTNEALEKLKVADVLPS